MNVEDYIKENNRLHEMKRQISIERENKISAIDAELKESINTARKWAECERRKIKDEAYKREIEVKAQITRLHFEFHSKEEQVS